MQYDSVLRYVEKVLENSHIPTHVVAEPFDSAVSMDRGLRESLRPGFKVEEAFQSFIQFIKDNTLYYFTDSYYCSYACLKFPTPELCQYFIIGPFTYVDINSHNFLKLAEQLKIPAEALPAMENYYFNIAFVPSESQFKNIIGTLADTIWQGNSNYDISIHHGNLFTSTFFDEIRLPEKDALYMLPANRQAVEERYEYENQCMLAVSQGNQALIDQLLSMENGMRPIPRLANSLRDFKNYMIIFNTILRKAAEQGGVHPVYLDELSSKFAKKIETLTSVTDHSIEREMLHKYCLLVHNYSVKGYSPIIQKVINQVNLNLTNDLSLKVMSEMFHISAGYLSTLFKKETGMTLTDYVNKRRVDHAVLLLNATNLQIQTIAAYCGINDMNYFTRIFKKYMDMTPKKYRDLISEEL